MPKEPAVTAETNIGEAKTRKPRVVKPKPTNYDQALAVVSDLNLEDMGALCEELMKRISAEVNKREELAKVGRDLTAKIFPHGNG